MTHAPVLHGPTEVLVKPGLPCPGPGPGPRWSEPQRQGGRSEHGRAACGRRAASVGTEIGDGKEADEKDTDEGYGGAAELLVEGMGSGFRLGHEVKGPFGGLKETHLSVFSALGRTDPTRSLFSSTLSHGRRWQVSLFFPLPFSLFLPCRLFQRHLCRPGSPFLG